MFKDKKFKDLTFYKTTKSKYWWCRVWVLEEKSYIQRSLEPIFVFNMDEEMSGAELL